MNKNINCLLYQLNEEVCDNCVCNAKEILIVKIGCSKQSI